MSSIKTAYLSVVSPPGPFVSVGLANRDGSIVIPNCGAQIDTAADRTVAPQRLIEQLGAPASREVELVGFGGVQVRSPVYEIWLMLPTFTPVLLEVAADVNEPWLLLGRDFLNKYKILLDGLSQQIVVEKP